MAAPVSRGVKSTRPLGRLQHQAIEPSAPPLGWRAPALRLPRRGRVYRASQSVWRQNKLALCPASPKVLAAVR